MHIEYRGHPPRIIIHSRSSASLPAPTPAPGEAVDPLIEELSLSSGMSFNCVRLSFKFIGLVGPAGAQRQPKHALPCHVMSSLKIVRVPGCSRRRHLAHSQHAEVMFPRSPSSPSQPPRPQASRIVFNVVASKPVSRRHRYESQPNITAASVGTS